MRAILWGTLGAVLGAAVLGLVGFAAGFFGPMIFTPESNQGPLLGIFVTGPGGIVLGLILGAIVGTLYGRNQSGGAGGKPGSGA